ncbi:unnamed protein product [Amoebophrya sp. A25]|nr:unnamed protein product [Amoebophrya sp. A25]|eukprot:GSA25T00005505001.1
MATITEPTCTVCFVCTGNTCRSFMAETVGRWVLDSLKSEYHGAADVKLVSRGTSLRENVPHPTAIEALKKSGCPIPEADMRKHVPTDLKASPPHVTDKESLVYYFCMTRQHREALLGVLGPLAFTSDRVKVFLLNDNSDDIPDPYNGPLEDYTGCLDTLQKWCKVVLVNLLKGREPFD